MTKVKELYRSKIHKREKSHDVCIIQDQSKVKGVKLKMTYECYNALERFTGEQWNGGKWEHTFSMLDLGVSEERTNYVSDDSVRLKRTEELIKKGIEYFNILNN
jgi:hypothetical protein